MTDSGEPRGQRFDVRATTVTGGQVVKPGVAAGSAEELVRDLAAQGLQVSEVRGRSARRLFEPRSFSTEDFTLFNSELAAAARRGVPLPDALRAISRDLGHRRVREAVERVAVELEQGRDLAEALAGQPRAFPPGYVALIRAGLASGNLPATLLVFANESRMVGRLRRNTRSALVYPLAILIGVSALMCLMGWTLLPLVASLVDEQDSPVVTTAIMRSAPMVLLAVLGVGFVAWQVVSRYSGGAAFLGWLSLKVPLVGRFLRAANSARFCRMLAGALHSRLGVPEAVELAGLSTGNAAFRRAAARAAGAIREGQPISNALGRAGRLFPTTLIWMLSLGEERGEVTEALEDYARLQEENAERLGQVIPAVAVTAMTVISAGLLFFSAVAVMGPLLRSLEMLGMSGGI